MKPKEIYEQAVKKWGEPLQMMMAVEEMAELTIEILKRFRARTAPEDFVIADMAHKAVKIKQQCKTLREIGSRYKDLFVTVPLETATLSEEMADVNIMLEQLRFMSDNTEEINEVFWKKIERLKRWLDVQGK